MNGVKASMKNRSRVMKLWERGLSLDKKIEDFTVGDDHIIDQKIIKYDCLASIAHVKMLGKIGILQKEETNKLISELTRIIKLDEKGEFLITKKQEDCHTAIENHLIKILGNLGKKIHTARSRNDQVLTALRLYYKEELIQCKLLVNEFITGVKIFLKKYGKIKIPGYTHTRKAMPSSINLWGNSFIESMNDNLKFIKFTSNLIDQSPLGSGAGYGIPFKIDRRYTAQLLGFKKIQKNPIYTQNSRGKFESTIIHSLVQIMFDLNKLATDLIIFSMPEFGYFMIPEKFCTGSSIMPQKKNPDALELVRARYHLVVSCEFEIKNLTANLLSGYNRDLQLTKQSVIKAIEITEQTLSIMTYIITKMKVDKENCQKAMTNEIYATDKVYQLVKKGIAFREAYMMVKKEM
jgi:argininosuccinate lyase